MGGRGGSSQPRGSKSARKKAIKLLTQYERLAKKYGVNLSKNKLAELNKKRDEGTITSNDLPSTLRKEFPGEFGATPLGEIR